MSDVNGVGGEGVYEVFQVKAGAGYDGWYLVVTAWPDTEGGILTEVMVLPLDEGSSFFRVVHRYVDFSVRGTLDLHRVTGIHMLDMARREGRRGDEDRPLKEVPAPTEVLRRLWFKTLTKPDDDPYRDLYRSGLLQLAKQTRCDALRAEMRSWPRGHELGI